MTASAVNGAPRRRPFDREHRRRLKLAIQAEKDFMASVLALARRYGWLCYHTWHSVNSEPGFPDLIAVRGERLLAIEFKRGSAKVTDDQRHWLAALDAVCPHVEAYVMRSVAEPDWTAIEATLR